MKKRTPKKYFIAWMFITIALTLITLIYARFFYCENHFELYLYQALNICTASIGILSIKYFLFFSFMLILIMILYHFVLKQFNKNKIRKKTK